MGSSNPPDGSYPINDVSQRVGLSQKRIREYEKNGLIKPAREPRTNNRKYTEADIQRIQRVKALIHEHGFTLACMKFFLASAPCWIIFDCAEKESCPSYNLPYTPCYELAKKSASHSRSRDCSTCPIYLNRDMQKMPLLEKA